MSNTDREEWEDFHRLQAVVKAVEARNGLVDNALQEVRHHRAEAEHHTLLLRHDIEAEAELMVNLSNKWGSEVVQKWLNDIT